MDIINSSADMFFQTLYFFIVVLGHEINNLVVGLIKLSNSSCNGIFWIEVPNCVFFNTHSFFNVEVLSVLSWSSQRWCQKMEKLLKPLLKHKVSASFLYFKLAYPLQYRFKSLYVHGYMLWSLFRSRCSLKIMLHSWCFYSQWPAILYNNPMDIIFRLLRYIIE